MSVRTDVPMAVVDRVVDQKGTREVAAGCLQFLYTGEAQDILARRWNRARSPGVSARYKSRFPAIRLVWVDDTFGGSDRVTAEHGLLGEKR